MKKILLSILCLSVVLAAFILLPTEVNAATDGYYTYEISNGEATITEVSIYISGDITIPSALGGYPVTTIGEDAFYYCRYPTSITIPNSVTTIGDSAFWGCSSLTSVTIPNSVTTIGDFAFRECTSLTGITIPDSVTTIGEDAFRSCRRLTSVKIPNSVTTIGRWAFSYCDSLTSVTIPNSVTTIGDYAFYSCDSLTSVTIPNSVTTIGDYAFSFCISLTSVTIPNSVTTIGDSAFYACSRLTGIWVDEKNNHYSSDAYGVLFNKDKSTLIQAPGSIEEYIIPNGVTTIGDFAFSNRYSLTSVTIGDGVTTISDYAFYNCSSLTSVTIPNSVTTIGNYAFRDCDSLTSVTIGNSVATIGDYAFYFCDSLTSVTIPNSVTTIGDSAFCNCYSLTSVTIPDSVTTIGEGAFSFCSSLTSITIPDSVTSIGSSAFHHCDSLTSVTIPDSVTTIGEGAFSFCSSLTSVTIPNSVTTIGSWAFSDCDLISITIPNSVTTIDSYVFRNCSRLNSVTIPDSVTTIGYYAFYDCDSLTDVYYTGAQEQWDQISIEDGNDDLMSANIIVNSIPAHNCTEYGEWVVTAEPTFTSAGERYLICTQCGETVTETLDILVGKVSQWNVALADDLLVNFYLQISESIESTAKVRIYVGENAYTFPVANLEKTDDGLYIAQVSAAAAQMNDFIYVSVINSSSCSETAAYTIRQYADTILADENHSDYHQMVKEMLNYGAAAQKYFNYEPDQLVNGGITGAGAAEIPETAQKPYVSNSLTGLSFHGASLVFRDRIAVRYYFAGDVTGCTFTANGKTYTPVAKDGMYYIEIADILPQDLERQITLIVRNAKDHTITVTYSPMNYIVRMNEKGSTELKALVKALYNYHLAAKALA